ncbi:alpha/beta hydrolase-fold protein [Nocardia sp. NRRL S-836]|uniref:alpha/beta hydrolase-fold protein n=1 Tax=Nocardia sp. NRRL S-836 TaxID=1519492 RepID=UPI0006AF1B0C|nr:alpha/beta hydrolase-fold protein [Nocardia sp. NRRL S-836]KOV80865.1 esterase [Nocardia sp. NRRL S-836]
MQARFSGYGLPGSPGTAEFWDSVRGPVPVPADGGYRTLFLWRGSPAVLRFESWSDPVELTRWQDTDCWYAEVPMPHRLRVTYHFFDGTEYDGEHADPFNPAGAGPNRSIAATPDLEPQPHWPVVGPDEVLDVPSTRLRWNGVLGRKTVRVHRGGEPVVLLLDGDDWMYVHPAVAAFESAVRNGEMPAATLVFLPTPRDRNAEYTGGALWPAVRDELLPLLAENGVTVNPERFVVAGQSLGGLSAFRAALDLPDLVSRVACQSGSFWWTPALPDHGLSLDGPAGGYTAERLRDADLSGLRVAFDVGEHEPRMHRHCEAVEGLAEKAGAAVRTNRSPAGHDRVGWRHALVRDVAWLLTDR